MPRGIPYASEEERLEAKRRRSREWKKANKEKVNDNTRAYKDRNREAMRSYRSAYKKANPEANRASVARRRTRLKVSMDTFDITISVEYRKAIASDPCFYCGKSGDEADHFFPLAKGGTDHWWNLVNSCKFCNTSKNDRCGTYFRLRNGDGVV